MVGNRMDISRDLPRWQRNESTHSSFTRTKGFQTKPWHWSLCDIPGELCISATCFSYEATRLCLTLDTITSLPTWTANAIKQILDTAGKYALIVQEHCSMSPKIFLDINKRILGRHWDQLTISANCCQYSTLLDVEELKQKGHNFSLSNLALCLLNGELLRNDCRIDFHHSFFRDFMLLPVNAAYLSIKVVVLPMLNSRGMEY
jgi:hypothetical protein